MITRDYSAFFEYVKTLPVRLERSCPKAVLLVQPNHFTLAEQSAQDNRYMQMQTEVNATQALFEHKHIQKRLAEVCAVQCFQSLPETPDAVFPNNVFAATEQHFIVGKMRHAVRQLEAEREDIRTYYMQDLGKTCIDLSQQNGICELTGALIIDRARGIGFCGLSERCDEQGARAMHEAFGLNATLLFDLAQTEYHTNVVLSILASRMAVIAESGFQLPEVAHAIAEFYAPAVVHLSDRQKAEFAGNCLAITDSTCWMSTRAEQSLTKAQRNLIQQHGFSLETVAMPNLELAGGSLRCCVAEIF